MFLQVCHICYQNLHEENGRKFIIFLLQAKKIYQPSGIHCNFSAKVITVKSPYRNCNDKLCFAKRSYPIQFEDQQDALFQLYPSIIGNYASKARLYVVSGKILMMLSAHTTKDSFWLGGDVCHTKPP